MSWINFKGADSRDLKGLVLCELPPISKPQIRIETTVIEGKNGDISESLGYSAYDKTLKIGLSAGFDINQIIKYFSGKGEVIFSNEPDKAYNCEIFDGVDFERLVKFRTANIKFHTQPFKYLKDEQPTILVIEDEKELEVKNVGNEVSKPIITLYGEEIVTISINNHAIFRINIDDNCVVIDSENEEAFKENTLKNRYMMGQFPSLELGLNIITWTGTLSKIKIYPKSRWL